MLLNTTVLVATDLGALINWPIELRDASVLGYRYPTSDPIVTTPRCALPGALEQLDPRGF